MGRHLGPHRHHVHRDAQGALPLHLFEDVSAGVAPVRHQDDASRAGIRQRGGREPHRRSEIRALVRIVFEEGLVRERAADRDANVGSPPGHHQPCRDVRLVGRRQEGLADVHLRLHQIERTDARRLVDDIDHRRRVARRLNRRQERRREDQQDGQEAKHGGRSARAALRPLLRRLAHAHPFRHATSSTSSSSDAKAASQTGGEAGMPIPGASTSVTAATRGPSARVTSS